VNARQGKDLLREYDRIALIGSAVTVALLILAYFSFALTNVIPPTVREFLLSVIANLIPVFIVLGTSYALFRTISGIQRQSEMDYLAQSLILELKPLLQGSQVPVVEQIVRPVQPDNEDQDLVSEEQRQIIEHVLRATSLGLICPRSETQVLIRTFCHLADRDKKVLRPICMWSLHHTNDYNASIPYDGPEAQPFIISEAFNENRVVARNLPRGHIKLYTASLQDKILPELKCIIAVPISDFEPGTQGRPLGTVSIDCSTAQLDELGFAEEEVKDVLIWCARAVYRILMMDRSVEMDGRGQK